MFLENLTLKNFRNHADRFFRFPGTSVVVLGGNGTGKTNLLEAVHYLSFGKSFRAPNDDCLVNTASASGSFYIRGETLTGSIRNRTEASFAPGSGKTLRYDGKAVSGRQLIGRNRSVLFYTDDMNLILGSAVHRRRYLDHLLGQTDPLYLDDLVRYNRTVKLKNSVLRAMKLKKKARTPRLTPESSAA
jgi:DNA replication and repair protein RecF